MRPKGRSRATAPKRKAVASHERSVARHENSTAIVGMAMLMQLPRNGPMKDVSRTAAKIRFCAVMAAASYCDRNRSRKRRARPVLRLTRRKLTR